MATAELDIRINSSDIPGATSRLKSLEGQGAKTEASVAALGSASVVAAAAVAAVGAAAVKSIAASRKFEKSLSDLSAITGATGEQLEYLKDQAADIGRTTSLSASEAAEAFKLIASAKPDLLESSTALNTVTRSAVLLAEAAGVALPDAADTLGSALNQWAADASEADRYINVLAAGSKYGAAEVSDVALALKMSGVSAAGAKVSFEQANAAIQSLASVAIKGSEAGTALRNIILKLETSSDNNLRPSVVGLTSALDNLGKKNLSTAEMAKMFGLENINAAQALVQNSKQVANLEQQLTGTNTALEQAKIRTGNLEGDMMKLSSATEALAIVIGDKLNPAARSGTQFLTDLANAAAMTIDSMFGSPETIDGIALRMSKVNDQIGELTTSLATYKAGSQSAFSDSMIQQTEIRIAALKDEYAALSEQLMKKQGVAFMPGEKPEKKTTPAKPLNQSPAAQPEETGQISKALQNEMAASQRQYDIKIDALAREQQAEADDYAQRLAAAGEFNARIEALNYTAAQKAAADRSARMVENQANYNNGLITEEQYQQNLTAIKQAYASERAEIDRQEMEKQQKAQQEVANLMIQQTQLTTSTITDLLRNSGKENSGMMQMLLAAQQALAIPSIMVSTEQAAMAAMAQQTMLGGLLAGTTAANLIRAQGAISVGIVAGQAIGKFAGAFDNGGNIPTGSWGIVGENGPEIVQGPVNVTSRKKTAALAASAASGGSGGGDTYVTINQTITGNGDEALAKVVNQATQNALNEVQKDFASNGRIRRTAGV